MVDEPIDPRDLSGPASPPQDGEASAPEAQHEAIGATAPLDDNVVHAAFGARRSKVDGTTPPPPPTPPNSAVARTSGKGGGEGAPPSGAGKPPAADKKPGKPIDWGKFNDLCSRFALIYGTDTVWDGGERIIMKISNMGHAHGADMVRMWKASERRRTVRQSDVVFDPTETCDAERCVNLFGGLAMEPEKGDVKPMLDLVRYLTSRACAAEDDCDMIMHWLLCWLAYPLQNRGAKLRTSVIMHGDEGAGKNFLFDTVVAIYGKYGALVGQDELEDKFNDWRSCKLFIVGDEVSSRAELVHNKNRLKALITSPTVQINPKNLPRREEANHINIVFLSNELQPLALDNSDRRYLVVYTPRAKEFEYYRQLKKWRDGGGTEAFFEYLMTYPLDGFDPSAPAPATEAKKALIALNRKSPELFWTEWQGGELDLPYWSCSVPQLYQAYVKYCQRSGDRFPFKREQFTPTILRFAESQDKPARVKVMNPDHEGTKKSERMFLVAEPVFRPATDDTPAQTQGDWATDAIQRFHEHMKVYMGWSRSPGGDDHGHGGQE
ncbi:hypothetical protein BH10PSE18_BH10PSE18_15110 [soil metagenome]